MRGIDTPPRVHRAVESLTDTLSAWDETEALTVVLSGEDVYDPYFFLSLDVYTASAVRDVSLRKQAFGDVLAFENSVFTHKDRFLLGEIPVRVEYKGVDRFDQLADAVEQGRAGLRDAGTYAFHRVVESEILFARTEWFERLRSRLTELPDSFWRNLRTAFQAAAEHTYSDLSAAAVRDDELYFSVSSGRFLVSVLSLLFAVNRQFEPSARFLTSRIASLPHVPDSLPANLENFVSPSHLSLGQRRELAEMMITGIIALYDR